YYENPVLTKSGEERTILWHNSALKDEDGSIIGHLSSGMDITERKRVEKKLKKERKRFQEIFNNANDAIYLHDLTEEGMPSEFIEVNDVACEMLGYSREEFLEMSPRDIDSSEKADEVPEVMEKLFNEGDVRFEMKHQAKDGTKIPVEINSHLLELEDEKRVLSVARDISERKKREEKLKKNEKRLKGSQRVANVGSWEIDLDTGELTWSDETYRIFGLPIGEPVTYDEFLEFIHPEDRDYVDKEWNEALETGEYDIDHRIVVDDEIKWVHEKADIIFNDDGEPIRVVGSVQDITERKKRKEREELLHSLLRHDVQNKAQVVEGYLELLKEDPEGNKEYVDKALKAAKESEDIIEKVRTLRKIEKEGIKETKIDSVLKEVMEENRDRANERGLEIKKTSSSLKCKVKAGSLLRELFNNITENAIQHSEGTKIKITCKEKQKEVICSIEDDGRGIPDEQKEKVFEKGFKSGETGGSGLGMYLAKQIIENYNGKIEVRDSELGGARFDIYLNKA
ncbi:MAG: Signal transduction histidine kinase with PAS and PocR sensory domain, partial [Candidatus Methanohalarchaeum thermophilum]